MIAGHSVPAELLPPERDAAVLREFAYRAGYCDHAQMTAPFAGLSMATIRSSMLTHDRRSEHRWFQLNHIAGPLGWRIEQLIEAAKQADRLSRRPDQGAWRPVSAGSAKQCPDMARPN